MRAYPGLRLRTAFALSAASAMLCSCTPDAQKQQEQGSLFNADRAFSHLTAQVELGPRVPGAKGHAGCRDYILRHLSGSAKTLQTQEFPVECLDDAVTGTNIVAGFGSGELAPVLFCCHWDTRPIADEDPEPQNRGKPIPGANDGASGVAVLLELATLFAKKPPPRRVYLVFFDAEDSGNYAECEYCIGSLFFAEHLDSVLPELPGFGVLVDMVGDRDLSLPKERYSVAAAPALVNRIWAIARRLGHDQFKDELGRAVFDDHIWLNEAGIPTINIIDFEYPFWHTLEDTADKCSRESLKAVGDVLLALAYED